MKLTKKTFLYSISISVIIMAFIVLYFSLMLPSLYIDYMKKENLKSVEELHKGYMEQRSYDGLVVKNPTSSATLEIPLQGKEIYLAGATFKITIQVNDEAVLRELDKIRNIAENYDFKSYDAERLNGVFPKDAEAIDVELLKEKLMPKFGDGSEYPIAFEIQRSAEKYGFEETGKVHMISKSMMIYEGGIRDHENRYSTYITLGKTEDALIISFFPVTTPEMNEIRPIVMESMPMLAAVVFLLVMLASQFFSKKIVNPVIRLAGYAEELRYQTSFGEAASEPLKIIGRDEIAELGMVLNELYGELRAKYRELEEKNNELKKENKRQEVFLRASSHQLKTPVTAALLLVDGMIGEIGKYKDKEKYLPEVKKQLQSMRKIVEDILYLNHCADNIMQEKIDLALLMQEVLGAYEVQIAERNLRLERIAGQGEICSDRELLKKILDNLATNAVSYTEEGGQIEVSVEENSVRIFNRNAHIEEELLQHIYEPFVSSNSRQKGRGLGLYVTSYYAQILGLKVSVFNYENGVMSILTVSSSEIHTGLLE